MNPSDLREVTRAAILVGIAFAGGEGALLEVRGTCQAMRLSQVGRFPDGGSSKEVVNGAKSDDLDFRTRALPVVPQAAGRQVVRLGPWTRIAPEDSQTSVVRQEAPSQSNRLQHRRTRLLTPRPGGLLKRVSQVRILPGALERVRALTCEDAGRGAPRLTPKCGFWDGIGVWSAEIPRALVLKQRP